LEGERKQVTVLFADLKGSMELLADRDPEEARKLLDPVLEHMMEAVHRYEGTVNQVMGDGIMALFGAPLAHEDHAVRACYAALRMQEMVKRYAEEVRRAQGVAVRIRIGLNSGEVVVRSIGSDLRMDYTAVGQTTHLAARMEQLADPGSTLLTSDTLALAERFIHETCTRQRIGREPLTIHADRGSAMTSKSVAFLLADLGITKTHSRPHVSNDNPFSEAQFKTFKYRPDFPARFGSIQDVRAHCHVFFPWYNVAHHHSGLGLLTPHDVHFGLTDQQVAARATVLATAYAIHPERFPAGLPHPPARPVEVWINPPKTRATKETRGLGNPRRCD